jgi:hypothetical protein
LGCSADAALRAFASTAQKSNAHGVFMSHFAEEALAGETTEVSLPCGTQVVKDAHGRSVQTNPE